MRDASVELLSQNCRVHVPIEPEAPVELEAPVQVVEPTKAESVSSLGTESDSGDEMVTRRAMTFGHFVPSARPAPQQQQPRGRDLTPPLPSPSNHSWKRQR